MVVATALSGLLLHRAAEASISKADWYQGGGVRSQIVAYTCAGLAKLALDQSRGGSLNYMKVWAQQSARSVLDEQIAKTSDAMLRVLQSPPLAGQSVSEWAKQQACR